MSDNGDDVDLPNNCTPSMEGDTATMLRALMESVASITREITTMKGQIASNTPPIPLGTHIEQGQTSHRQQGPLPSQRHVKRQEERPAESMLLDRHPSTPILECLQGKSFLLLLLLILLGNKVVSFEVDLAQIKGDLRDLRLGNYNCTFSLM